MNGLNKGPILVTGASGGIGGAIVRHLSEAGADIIANGRDQEKLEELANETGCRTLAFDLESEDEIREALEGLDPVSYTHLTLPTIYSV